MKLRTAVELAPPLAGAKLFGLRAPLIVSLVLTSRCNYRCHYCGCWSKNGVELSHDRLLALFRELPRAGTRKIIFTGGEPLLRDDCGELIRAATHYGLTVAINTNGSLVEQHLSELRLVSGVSLSLDGPEAVHDAMRGPGAFQALIQAADRLQRERIPVRFAVVLSRLNLDSMPDILATCRVYRASLSVQPASQTLLFAEEENRYTPAPLAFRTCIDALIAAKRRGERVSNSYEGLRYLRSWPEARPIRCSGGKIFCRIESDGGITICGRGAGKTVAAYIDEMPFLDGFKRISTPQCNACWCGLLAELNLSFAMQFATIRNTLLYF